MSATEKQTGATATTSAAGLPVGRCRSAIGSLPGRYPRNAHAVTNNNAITATARAVDLSIPAIGTPIGWAYPHPGTFVDPADAYFGRLSLAR